MDTGTTYWRTPESTQPTGIILVLVLHIPLILSFVVVSCFVVEGLVPRLLSWLQPEGSAEAPPTIPQFDVVSRNGGP